MFTQRIISLSTDQQKLLAIAAIQNMPTGHNLEVVIREVKKQRSLDQQALMFAGPLKDISEQVWVENRQFSVEAWHEHFKQEFMVDDASEPYLHEHVTKPDSYQKWSYMPDGSRRCTASTTQLTKYGYTQYLEQIYAFGSERGVMFSSNPNH